MNSIKEFLKPNRWKISIAVILGLTTIAQSFLDAYEGVFPYFNNLFFKYGFISNSMEGEEWTVLLTIIFSILLLPLFFLELLSTRDGVIGFDINYNSGDFIIFLIFHLIYWYLLSCLIYFIFRKFKKKAVG